MENYQLKVYLKSYPLLTYCHLSFMSFIVVTIEIKYFLFLRFKLSHSMTRLVFHHNMRICVGTSWYHLWFDYNVHSMDVDLDNTWARLALNRKNPRDVFRSNLRTLWLVKLYFCHKVAIWPNWMNIWYSCYNIMFNVLGDLLNSQYSFRLLLW